MATSAQATLLALALATTGCGTSDEQSVAPGPTTIPAIVVSPPAPRSARPVRDVDQPVTPLDGPAPIYPPALKAMGIEGSVRLRFMVDAEGRVDPGSFEVVRATRAGFAPAAIAAVREWRFTPARRGGVAVPQEVEQNVRFTLPEGAARHDGIAGDGREATSASRPPASPVVVAFRARTRL